MHTHGRDKFTVFKFGLNELKKTIIKTKRIRIA